MIFLYLDVIVDDDVDIEDDNGEDEPNITASCLDTVMKLLRILSCSEKQSQSVRELQEFLATVSWVNCSSQQ